MNKLIVLLFSAVFMLGCYYDKEDELYPNSGSTTSTTTPVAASYKNDIQPLLTNNCATPGCHVSGASFPDLSTYAGVFGSRANVRDRANNAANPMPGSGLMSVANRNLLNSWIDAGAPNN